MSDGRVTIDTELDNSGVEEGLGKLGNIAKSGLKVVTGAIVTAGTAIAGMGAAAVKVGSNFESSMSQVAATMGITVDEIKNGSESFELLKNAAKDAGASTQFSASQSAEALNYLALAGYDAEKAVNALPKVLNLAAAGGLELGYASDLVTDSMSALGLETEELESFVDQLAKTSQKSNTSVGQLGEAILTVGGTAKILAGGTTELNTALGILADNGVKGAEGGTALRNIILSLSAPTDTAAEALDNLGVTAFDAEGNFRSLDDTFIDLFKSLDNLTDQEKKEALTKIFNKTDLKAVEALLAMCGGRFDELSGAINNSAGAAENMAETMNDNLKGKITILGSSLEGLGIQVYEKMEKPLKKGVETAIDAIGQLSERLSNGDLSESVDNLAEGFGELIGKLADFAVQVLPLVLDGLNWLIDNGNTIGTMFVSATSAIVAFKAVAFIGEVVDVWNKAKDVAIAYNTAIQLSKNSELLLASTMSAREVIVAVLTGNMTLATAATTLWTAATKALSKAMAFVGGPIGLIVIAISALAAGIIYLWNTNEGFRNAIINAWNAIKDTAIVVWEWLVKFFTEDIPNAWNSVVEFFTGIPEWFGELWSRVTEKFQEWGTNITNFFTETIPQWIENIFNWFNELPYRLGYALGYALGAIIQWGVDTWNYLVTNVPIWIENIVTFFSELPEKIWTWLVNTYNKVIAWGSDMVVKASETASNFISNIINWIKELPSRFSTWLTNTITKVSEFASNLGRKALEAGSNMVENIVNAVKNLPSTMIDIGKNIVEGVWNGIVGMGSWISDKVSGFFSGIVDGAKSILGIHSPSRVMRDQVGKYMAQGVGVGFENESKNIERDMDKNIQELVYKMQATVDYETAVTTARVVTHNNKLSGGIEEKDSKVGKQVIQNHIHVDVEGREVAYAIAPYQNILNEYYEGR